MKSIKTNEKGFSLVELLVVVIIIAIIAAIAIPSLLASRRAANEASAISSLRTIHSAQATYFGTTGGNAAYAPTLAALGTAGLIDSALAAASTSAAAKSGYFFGATIGTTPNIYCTNAQPAVASGITATGNRIFAVSTDGVIYTSLTTGANAPTCAAGVMTTNGALPIQ